METTKPVANSFTIEHLNKFVEITYKQPESHKIFRMAGRLLGFYDNGKGTEWWMAKMSTRRYAVEFTVRVLEETQDLPKPRPTPRQQALHPAAHQITAPASETIGAIQ